MSQSAASKGELVTTNELQCELWSQEATVHDGEFDFIGVLENLNPRPLSAETLHVP